jgi:hypothetical protein
MSSITTDSLDSVFLIKLVEIYEIVDVDGRSKSSG